MGHQIIPPAAELECVEVAVYACDTYCTNCLFAEMQTWRNDANLPLYTQMCIPSSEYPYRATAYEIVAPSPCEEPISGNTSEWGF